MARARKISFAILALLCALMLGFALSACGGKDVEPSYGYGEEGTYYYSVSDDTDYLLTLGGGSYILDMGASGHTGVYECADGAITFFEEGEEAGTGYTTDAGFSLAWEGRSYLFLRYEYYTVSFMDGGTTITTRSVLNGKAAQDPGDATKEGYVFLGWYADSDFTTRYEFNTSITQNTTIYARFVEVTGVTEYKITYDFGNGETTESETLNGKIYDLPEAEREGYVFLGWWVSATNSADELTYKYDGETLNEDTTLYAFFVEDGASYVGASVYDDRLTWENYNAALTEIILMDESGVQVETFSIQSTDGSYSYDFASLPAGKYTMVIRGGGIDETLVYVSNGLSRVSGFTVISGSVLMYSAVDNAERYYISIDCGTEGHDHSYIDNGTSLYYDFSSCEMPAEGITFTVYAYAEGYYYSVSSYNYFLGLDKAEVTVEGSLISWTPVSMAMSYEVYIDGVLVATTSGTSYSLSGYGTGTYEISVRPVTSGYYSEKSDVYSFTKTTLAAPKVTGIENYVVSWTETDGATGYKINIGGVETTVEEGITSLYLTDENYTEGLDSYEISVKALAPDSANDSPYGESITVTGNSVGSAVSYDNGTVTWQYSLSASEYRITVNDGDETVVFGRNSSPVTLTKSGNNEITIYFVDADDEIYGVASMNVYAYAIVFDARGGTAYMDGEVVDTIYAAKGDTVTLPEADMGAIIADFLGWYTLPDMTDDPDSVTYQGDGVRYGGEDESFIFTGNSTIVLYACWLNPRLLVSLDPGRGTLKDENGNYITETYISLNGRSYMVAVPETTDAAYVFYGWYSGENGTGTRYTDEYGDAYAPFSDGNVTTLYAYWIQILNITSASYNNNTSEKYNVFSVSKGPDIGLVSEVTIPESYVVDGVEYTQGIINGSAFSSCKNLRTINIPDAIIFINITGNGYDSGSGVFASTALENVNVYATGEPSTTKEVIYYSYDGVLFQKTDSGDAELMYYPYGRTDETYFLPETVQNDNEYEYDGNGLSQTLVVRTVASIAPSVFRANGTLTEIHIPESVTAIGSYAFYGSSLRYAEIEGEVATIDAYTFQNCASLEEIFLADGVREIGTYAFAYCSSLKSFSMTDSVTTLGTYCFYQCSSLEIVRISPNVATIPSSCFRYCTSLRGVDMPYGVTEIATYAFSDCESLVGFTMPDSVTTMGTYAFNDCYFLESVKLSQNLTAIPSNAFQKCYRLKSIDIPSGCTSIGQSAFDCCYALTTVTLPDTLTKIDSYAFRNCWSLVSVTLPASLGSSGIGSSAFRYCYNLVEVYNLTSYSITAGSSSSTAGYVGQYAKNVYTAEGGSHMSHVDGLYLIYDSSDKYYLVGYDGKGGDITLPETVEGNSYEINQYAFCYDNSITSVSIPEGVTAIGGYAFYACESLTGVNVPSSVSSVETYTFSGCTSLETVEMAEGIASMDTYAFQNCTSLMSVTLPDSLTSVGANAFNGCSSLIQITLGEGLTSIGNNAFTGCYKLVEIYNRSSLTLTKGGGSSDNGGVALYAKSIYTVSGGTCISVDGDYKFVYGDGTLYLIGYYGTDTDITLPADHNGSSYEILGYAFYLNTSLKSVTIPDSVTAVGDYAFYGCTSLRNVTMGSRVGAIGSYAFYNCTSLNNLVIPDSVETIGAYAFYNCTSLERITMGRGLVSSGSNAFNGCSALTAVYIYDIEAWCGISFADATSNPTYYTMNLYLDGVLLTDLIVPDSITYVGDYAFYNCAAIESVALSPRLTGLGDYCFYGCSSVGSIVIPDGVAEIGYAAFRGCSSLGYAYLPEGLETIGDYAFFGCSGISDMKLPESLKTLGERSFCDCSGLVSINLPDGLESLGQYSFYGCSSLESISVPEGITEIEGYMFYNCTSLSSVSMGDGVTSIGTYAFGYCTSLTGITLPACLTTLLASAFYYCSKLQTVDMPDGLVTIANYAFSGCSALTSITIPTSVESIGTDGFRSCSSLASVYTADLSAWIAIDFGNYYGNPVYVGADLYAAGVKVDFANLVIPEGTTKIGKYAFYGMDVMKSVTIPESVTEIGTYAFYNCHYLTEINYNAAACADFTTASNYVFYNAGQSGSGITMTIGRNVTAIPAYLFSPYGTSTTYSPYVTSIVFADGCALEKIGNYAFRNLVYITGVTLPGSLKTIGQYAFYGCTGLKSVTFPDGLETIDMYAFQNCTSLTEVTLPKGLTTLNGYSFSGCTAVEKLYVESTGLTDVANYSFQNWNSLTGVYIYDLGAWAQIDFAGYYGNPLYYSQNFYLNGVLVTALDIPEGTTKIGRYSFYGYKNAVRITIPSTVTSIGIDAFYECNYVTEINYNATSCDNMSSASNQVFGNAGTSAGGIAVTIGANAQRIPQYLFTPYNSNNSYAPNITSVTFADGCVCEEIAGYAFRYLSITSIELPSSLKTIGTYAFAGCTSLTGIVIPDSVTELGTYAFATCSKLEWVVIGSGMKTIGNYAFNSDSKISAVYYNGDEAGWNSISISSTGSGNNYLNSATRYYYSETEPADDGNWWHWVDGEVVVWKKG